MLRLTLVLCQTLLRAAAFAPCSHSQGGIPRGKQGQERLATILQCDDPERHAPGHRAFCRKNDRICDSSSCPGLCPVLRRSWSYSTRLTISVDILMNVCRFCIGSLWVWVGQAMVGAALAACALVGQTNNQTAVRHVKAPAGWPTKALLRGVRREGSQRGGILDGSHASTERYGIFEPMGYVVLGAA